MSASRPEWQILTDEGDELTEQLRVPGGWLYRTTVTTVGYDRLISRSVALAFQPEAAR